MRRNLGLPAPLGFTAAVAKELDLDPAAPSRPDPHYEWSEDDLRGLVQSAHAWCRGTYAIR